VHPLIHVGADDDAIDISVTDRGVGIWELPQTSRASVREIGCLTCNPDHAELCIAGKG